MGRARERTGFRRVCTLAGVGATTLLAATAYSETAFDKAMRDMGQLYFVENHCAETMVVVITDPAMETLYKDAVKVRPGAFRDAVRASEKSLGDTAALAAACTKIFDRFNGPEIFVNNRE